MRKLQRTLRNLPIRVIVQGEVYNPVGISPRVTVTINDRSLLPSLLTDPEIAFGEGYAHGLIQVEGDLVALLEAVYSSQLASPSSGGWYSRLASRFQDVLHSNTLAGSRNNIHQHYDLGNDFYKLWLDRDLVYTCAYFPAPSATLDQAQTAKMDYVCRKLRLQPSETVVEGVRRLCIWRATTASR